MQTLPHRTFAHRIGNWWIWLQLEQLEPETAPAANDDAAYIDWDTLSLQHEVPVNVSGTGLQLCADCGESVAPDSARFLNRTPLAGFTWRVGRDFRFPVGAYLCARCLGNRQIDEMQMQSVPQLSEHQEDLAPDSHLEMLHEDRFASDFEPYEPSPYDGTFSDD